MLNYLWKNSKIDVSQKYINIENFHSQVHSSVESHIIIVSLNKKISIHQESTKCSYTSKAHYRSDHKRIVSVVSQSLFINILEMLQSASSVVED